MSASVDQRLYANDLEHDYFSEVTDAVNTNSADSRNGSWRIDAFKSRSGSNSLLRMKERKIRAEELEVKRKNCRETLREESRGFGKVGNSIKEKVSCIAEGTTRLREKLTSKSFELKQKFMGFQHSVKLVKDDLEDQVCVKDGFFQSFSTPSNSKNKNESFVNRTFVRMRKTVSFAEQKPCPNKVGDIEVEFNNNIEKKMKKGRRSFAPENFSFAFDKPL